MLIATSQTNKDSDRARGSTFQNPSFKFYLFDKHEPSRYIPNII